MSIPMAYKRCARNSVVCKIHNLFQWYRGVLELLSEPRQAKKRTQSLEQRLVLAAKFYSPLFTGRMSYTW